MVANYFLRASSTSNINPRHHLSLYSWTPHTLGHVETWFKSGLLPIFEEDSPPPPAVKFNLYHPLHSHCHSCIFITSSMPDAATHFRQSHFNTTLLNRYFYLKFTDEEASFKDLPTNKCLGFEPRAVWCRAQALATMPGWDLVPAVESHQNGDNWNDQKGPWKHLLYNPVSGVEAPSEFMQIFSYP